MLGWSVLHYGRASVPVHKVTKANRRRRTPAITAISHQPPTALHMLMPLQPVTLTFMTSLSAQPDIMLACHCCDLWPQRLSCLNEAATPSKTAKVASSVNMAATRLDVSVHQSSRIRHPSIRDPCDSWEPPTPPICHYDRNTHPHSHTHNLVDCDYDLNYYHDRGPPLSP